MKGLGGEQEHGLFQPSIIRLEIHDFKKFDNFL